MSPLLHDPRVAEAHLLSPRAALRRYSVVTFLMWLPAGLTMAPAVLLMTSRGLDLAEIGVVMAIFNVVVVVLELPTGGLTDVIGRRTVLAVSAASSMAGMVAMAMASSVWPFVLASVLKGAARALASGPAQAWYVDMLHAARGPGADLKPGLARGEAMGSVSLCLATLAGGLMPLVLPGGLVTPFLAAAVAAGVLLVAALVAMPEPPRPRVSLRSVLRDVPATVRSGLGMALRDRGLSRLLLISAAVGTALCVIELLTPGRMAALTGRVESGGSTYALVASVGFAANAAGSLLAPVAARRMKGSAGGAVAGTIVSAAALGALAASVFLSGVAGIAAACGAYVVLFAGLSVSELLRTEMLHGRVGASRRATLMSVDSLQLQLGVALASVTLGYLASRAGMGAAWWAGAGVLLLSALLYVRLPAPRREGPAAGS
jgi:predicted MFS family arabinose efflux permease